jgi:IS5 family transposase
MLTRSLMSSSREPGRKPTRKERRWLTNSARLLQAESEATAFGREYYRRHNSSAIRHRANVPCPDDSIHPAPGLLELLPPAMTLLADAAYDSDAFRQFLTKRGTTPIIKQNPTRKCGSTRPPEA